MYFPEIVLRQPNAPLERIEKVRAFSGRTFHDLVTLSRLAAWGLGPLPTAENLNHEETTRRSEYSQFVFPFSRQIGRAHV